MKKILSSIPAVVAMMTMTTVFTACSSDDEGPSSPTLTIAAARSDYNVSNTRAITADGDKIVTSWKTTDKVVVFKEGWTKEIGNLSPMADSQNNVTKLDGSIQSGDLNVGDKMEFIMPRSKWEYTGQDGTIETISSTYDYAIANVQITFFDQNNKVYGSDAYFKTQQAIVRYKLVDGSGNPLKAKSLTIVSEKGQLVKSRSLDGKTVEHGGLEITPKNANTNVYYVAICDESGGADKYTITAKVDDEVYTSTSTRAQEYKKGDYVRHTVTMSIFDDTHTERDVYEDKGDVTW